jgi:uncharacterized protein (TIGR02147 family)
MKTWRVIMITTQTETKETREKVNIFEFSDYADYLNSYVNRYGRYGHGPFNLKNWANRLGYRSASSLTMILNKSRLPTYKMINAFVEDFKLNRSERRYFELLVELERRKSSGQPIHELLNEIKRISGFSEYQKIDVDKFNVVSDWHCYVIKRLVSLSDFKLDVEWIFNKLRKKVSRKNIKSAIESLEKVGMLSFDSQKGFFDHEPKTHTGNDIPSSAIRHHHKGMIERSLEALEEQTIEERLFQGLTICVDKERDLNMAFEDIQKFINQFNRKYSKDGLGKSVYQLNVAFFDHTADDEGVKQ